jgi:ABC-type multidrug transport system fused ATPase/permease subunit
MSWFLFANFVFWNFAMCITSSFIDFWLRTEAAGGSSSTFDFLNSWFDNNTANIFTFLTIINISVTAIRCCFYIICALLAASKMFKNLNKAIFFSKMKFFDTNPNGRIVNRISNDTFIIDGILSYLYIIITKNNIKYR